MEARRLRCASCGVVLVNQQGSTVLKCPSCLKVDIVRCFACRQIAAKYTCSECGFVGPN